MNKVVITTISSIMTIFILTAMMTSPVVATIDEEDSESQCDIIDSEHYDARCDYTNKECAEMFHPEYDRGGYLTCTGGIGWSNPGP